MLEMTKATVKWRVAILLLLALALDFSSGEPNIIADYQLNGLSDGTTSVSSSGNSTVQPVINFPSKEKSLL
jgi:hypothetical protein